VSAFDLYSQYYDLLYRDKDYHAEAAYVTSLARRFHPSGKTLLDLGCGTGKHASLFHAAGYAVEGVDLSATMLERARHQFPTLSFHQGDARTVRLSRRFDVVTSLFHVASYQTADADFASYLATARTHMAPGGIFIFDFWYGPGVTSDPPVVRVKRLADDKIRVTRIAEPTHHAERHVVNVHYEVLVRPQGSDRVQEIVENHAMRYFFPDQLTAALEANGFKTLALLGWMSPAVPTAQSWNACIVAGLV
jgi:SAM-dependent methyltransferase